MSCLLYATSAVVESRLAVSSQTIAATSCTIRRWHGSRRRCRHCWKCSIQAEKDYYTRYGCRVIREGVGIKGVAAAADLRRTHAGAIAAALSFGVPMTVLSKGDV